MIAIIAIFIGLLLPAVQKVREAASPHAVPEQPQAIGPGHHNFQSTFSYLLPRRRRHRLRQLPAGPSQFDNFSFFRIILPFIEQQNTYNSDDPRLDLRGIAEQHRRGEDGHQDLPLPSNALRPAADSITRDSATPTTAPRSTPMSIRTRACAINLTRTNGALYWAGPNCLGADSAGRTSIGHRRHEQHHR